MGEIQTVFTSWPQFVLASLVLLLAQGVYVLFGFGAGLIAIGLLALLLPSVPDVVVMLLLVNLPAELLVVAGARRQVVWREVALIGLGIVAGVPLGTWVLRHGEGGLILTMLGVFLIVTGGVFLAIPNGKPARRPAWIAPPVGLLGGVLSGMFGTGGPPVIVYYRLGGASKSVFRGSLMAIFALVTLTRLPAYALAGLLTAPRLWSGLAMLPAALLGAWAGHRIHVRVSERTFQRLVAAALAVIGGLLLLRRP